MANPLYNMLGGGGMQGPSAMIMLINALKNGGNPQALINQMAQSNPKLAEAMQLLQGRSPEELERICRNVCAQRGMDFNSVVSQVQQMMRKN